MKQSDVDFLNSYQAGGGTVLVQQPGGGYAPAQPADLNGGGAAGPGGPGGAAGGPPAGGNGNLSPAAAKAQAQHQRVLYQQQKAAQRAADQKHKQHQQAATRGAMLGLEAAGGRFAALGDRVRSLNEWAANKPTPGGIGLMLIFLGVTIAAIVPVNGEHTRLELLGMTLLNQTYIPESETATEARDSGKLSQGASGQSSDGTSVTIPTLPGLPGIQVPLPTLPKIRLPGQTAVLNSPVIVPQYGQLGAPMPLGGTGMRQ